METVETIIMCLWIVLLGHATSPVTSSQNLSLIFVFSNYLKISLLIARLHLVDFSTQLTRIFIFWFSVFVFHDKYQSYKYEEENSREIS